MSLIQQLRIDPSQTHGIRSMCDQVLLPMCCQQLILASKYCIQCLQHDTTPEPCPVLQSEAEKLLRPEDNQKPLNLRNEAAALALLLANQQSEP